MLLLSVGVLITALTILIMGLFVLLRSTRSTINVSFALFCMLLAFWLSVNFLGANYKEYTFAQYFILADFISGPLVLYLFWSFSRNLLTSSIRRPSPSRFKISLGLLAVFTALSSLSSLIVVIGVNEELHTFIKYGPFYSLYSISLGFLASLGIFNLLQAFRSATNPLKIQISTIIWGLGIAIASVLSANLIIPALTDAESVNLLAGNLSYLGIIFFVGITMFAIVQHRLFDIKLVVARSVAYTLMLATMTGIYVMVVFGLAQRVFPFDSRFSTQVVPILVAILLAFTSSYLKRFFDRVTNKIFYRDAYDPQAFLDELNKVLVGNIEINILIRSATEVIDKYLKSSYSLIGVRESESVNMRVFGTKQVNFNKNEVQYVRDSLQKKEDRFVVTDDLGPLDVQLQDILRENDIGIIVRLVDSKNLHDSAIAYLILGVKKSGNIYSKQDFRILNIIADEMLIAIQNALRFEEIQGFAAKLQLEVNEATAKLQKTNRKLRELDETKDEFISMASHQLRTPLTSIKGYISMVLEGDAGDLKKPQTELLNQAFFSAQRMVYLIADLLNVSRLKTGKFVIDARPCNLADVVESEISQLKHTAKIKGVELSFDKPKTFPELMLDDTKIRQVIMNFADNAVYYTPRGGKIKIELREDGTSVYCTVKDTGLGVPKDEKAKLFTKFYRGSNARKARPDGTGLGLFMAKKVVEAQDGHIIFDSTEGHGSTFGFTFSKKKLSVEPDNKYSH